MRDRGTGVVAREGHAHDETGHLRQPAGTVQRPDSRRDSADGTGRSRTYGCGRGTGAPGHRGGRGTVLAVKIRPDGIRPDGFAWVLRHACPSPCVSGPHEYRAPWQRELRRAPARVRWDVERALRFDALPHRSLRLGLPGEAADRSGC
ncbi:DUF4291 family protein [Streptomyces sp. NPDC058464]|uniref:DUF4291 family protein n=1 Tax=Streptomyces sp. NPDC058464 TaxID=3346511 RepID=UPI00365304C8